MWEDQKKRPSQTGGLKSNEEKNEGRPARGVSRHRLLLGSPSQWSESFSKAFASRNSFSKAIGGLLPLPNLSQAILQLLNIRTDLRFHCAL